ncbi:MAG: recombinase family protein [Polyangiaceae bacterium]
MKRSARRSKNGNPTIAVAYCRVSTDRTRQELGEAGQRAAIEAWSKREGVTIAAWYSEEVSGGAALDKRPVLLEALAATAAHGAGLLVVSRIDRFSREPLTAALAEAELLRHGASLAVADGAGSGDDPTGQLVRGILFSVARFEKAMIRARIKAALAVKKARGELTGTAPYGFRVGADGKTLEPDEREAAVLAEVREMRASGLAVRAVLAKATARGLVGRAGRPFTLPSLHAMIRGVEIGD